eukprot:9848311-Alexandrium_andersonii.AAC.1
MDALAVLQQRTTACPELNIVARNTHSVTRCSCTTLRGSGAAPVYEAIWQTRSPGGLPPSP